MHACMHAYIHTCIRERERERALLGTISIYIHAYIQGSSSSTCLKQSPLASKPFAPSRRLAACTGVYVYMYTYMYIYTCIYTHTYMHTYIYAYVLYTCMICIYWWVPFVMYVCMYVWMIEWMNVCMHVYMYVSIHASMYVSLYVSMHVSVYVRMCIHITPKRLFPATHGTPWKNMPTGMRACMHDSYTHTHIAIPLTQACMRVRIGTCIHNACVRTHQHAHTRTCTHTQYTQTFISPRHEGPCYWHSRSPGKSVASVAWSSACIKAGDGQASCYVMYACYAMYAYVYMHAMLYMLRYIYAWKHFGPTRWYSQRSWLIYSTKLRGGLAVPSIPSIRTILNTIMDPGSASEEASGSARDSGTGTTGRGSG